MRLNAKEVFLRYDRVSIEPGDDHMKSRLWSLIEVTFVFVAMVGMFHMMNTIQIAADLIDALNGRLFPGYAALLLASFLLYRLRTADETPAPILQQLQDQLPIAAIGFLPFFVLSVVLSWLDWSRWWGTLVICAVEAGLLLWLVNLFKGKATRPSAGLAGALLLMPLAASFSARVTLVALDILYVYFLVALGEELLFRGYVQTRLNRTFDRVWKLGDVKVGWGWLLSSLLFGLWHAGWFTGLQGWPHVLWTIGAGLLLGYVREKSDGIAAPALLHGVMNYGPQAILFYLFWAG